jgi:hypothetical protein
MLSVRLVIGADSLEVAGDLTLAEVVPVLHEWYNALPDAAQRQIDQLTARARTANTTLEHAVDAATPTP